MSAAPAFTSGENAQGATQYYLSQETREERTRPALDAISVHDSWQSQLVMPSNITRRLNTMRDRTWRSHFAGTATIVFVAASLKRDRAWLSRFSSCTMPTPHRLQIRMEGFLELYHRLRPKNEENLHFQQQYAQLVATLGIALERLSDAYGTLIDRVILVSDELVQGINLNDLSYYGTALYLILREKAQSDDMYDQIIDTVFAQVNASMLRLQVHLLGQQEWERLQHEEGMAASIRERTLLLASWR